MKRNFLTSVSVLATNLLLNDTSPASDSVFETSSPSFVLAASNTTERNHMMHVSHGSCRSSDENGTTCVPGVGLGVGSSSWHGNKLTVKGRVSFYGGGVNLITNAKSYAESQKLTISSDTDGSIVQLGSPILLKLSEDGSWIVNITTPHKLPCKIILEYDDQHGKQTETILNPQCVKEK
jgi:hypothetical protein